MTKSYFKDILDELSMKYPNSKIFVISDEHFFHKNIALYTRVEFKNLSEMHDLIINKHNSVVGDNDIVLFLGDFSFKTNEIKELNEKLNGHKYLILGNHDDKKILKKYKKYGFSGAFEYPVKLGDIYLSHEPLVEDEKKDFHFGLLENEFNKSDGVNYHGHYHTKENIGPNYFNTSCEALDYEPKYLLNTHDSVTKKLPIISSPTFEKDLAELKQYFSINDDVLIMDYIYSLMLESLTHNNADCVVYGSVPLYKRYGFVSRFSDLDVGIMYDDSQSRKINFDKIKNTSDSVYQSLVDVPNLELSYYKKYTNMCIFSAMLRDGVRAIQTFYDSNLVPLNVYKESDLVKDSHITELEKILRRYDPSILDEYHFPNYDVNFLTTPANIASLVLQIIYQNENLNKRAMSLKKLKYVSRNPKEKYSDLKELEDVFIRFLIRNISLLDTVKRKSEILNIQDGIGDINFLLNSCDSMLREELKEILLDPNSEFNKYYDEIKKAGLDDIKSLNKEMIRSLKHI